MLSLNPIEPLTSLSPAFQLCLSIPFFCNSDSSPTPGAHPLPPVTFSGLGLTCSLTEDHVWVAVTDGARPGVCLGGHLPLRPAGGAAGEDWVGTGGDGAARG